MRFTERQQVVITTMGLRDWNQVRDEQRHRILTKGGAKDPG
jgi:hypothetical protein